jgi:hypothetical protein
MQNLFGIAFGLAVLTATGRGQSGITQHAQSGPVFADFPVNSVYSGPFAKPKFQTKADQEMLRTVLWPGNVALNFAGQFAIVRFQMGNGPTGALLVDGGSGAVFRMPRGTVRDDYFIHDTDCLPLYRKWQRPDAGDEEDDSVPLSFKVTSELLILRQCRVVRGSVVGIDKNYYRWHGRKWHFVKRISMAPPPPVPVQ